MAGRLFLPSLVLGFHRCDRAIASSVFSDKRSLRPSGNEHDWLGAGIYFWEADPRRATEWAVELQGRGRIADPAVVGAVMNPGNCLIDRSDLEHIRNAYHQLVRLVAEAGATVPVIRPIRGGKDILLRSLDCATINRCIDLQMERGGVPFDTVRSAFVEGEPLYPIAGCSDRNHIQFCVVNPACIKRKFHPLREDTN